jgi:DNA-binding NtrC family response regulator
MRPLTVVIAQNDPGIAQKLASDLEAHSARVIVAENALELRTLFLRHEARVAFLDLDLVNLEQVRQWVVTFDELTIVCTHRSPDAQMWLAALNAGAVELCHPDDIRSIVRASSACTGNGLTSRVVLA